MDTVTSTQIHTISKEKKFNYFTLTDTRKVFMPLKKNSKEPIIKYNKLNCTPFDDFMKNEGCNTAILTGQINGIIVIDVDLYKKDANDKWTELLQKINNGKELNTLTVETGRGGRHYYFHYTTQLPRVIGLDGYIDVKTDSGYVVCPKSTVNGHEYKVIKDCEIIQIPEKLLMELLSYYKNKEKINEYDLNQKNERYIITDLHVKELTKILYGLPQEYVDEFHLWFPICTALHNAKLFGLADRWSQLSETKYHKVKNKKILSKITSKLDIGYIYALGRQNNIEFEQTPNKYVEFVDITRELYNCTYDDSQYIDTPKFVKLLEENDIVIGKAPTGSGKSDNTKASLNYLFTNKLVPVDTKILSIVSRVTLAYQHEAYLNKVELSIPEKNLGLDEMVLNFTNYDKNKKKSLANVDKLIVQIDSLLKTDRDYGIIILDEFSNLINHLTTSTTLRDKRVNIMKKLVNICQAAKKIIVLDANFNDNCLYFLEEMLKNKKNAMYWNKCKNLENTNVYFIDQKTFDNVFHSYINMDKDFIFTSNEKRYIDDYSRYSKEDRKLVFTSEQGDREILLNKTKLIMKQIYYSPAVLYGNDFNFKNDVFVYCTDSTLDADQLIQQMTRCRQIDNIYICSKTVFHPMLFKSIKAVKDYYMNIDNYYELNEVDKEIIGTNLKIENDIRIHFSNLWAYEKMKRSILINNIPIHLRNILTARGAKIHDKLDIMDCKKKKVDEIDSEVDKELFIKYADNLFNGRHLQVDSRYKMKCEDIENKFDIIWTDGDMSVFNKDDYIQLLELLVDNDKFKTHLNIRLLLYNDDYNRKRLDDIKANEFKENIYNCSLNKVIMYKKLCECIENKKDLDKGLLESIVKVFRITQKKIDLEKIRRTIQKNLFGNLFDIIKKRKTHTSKRQYVISFNENTLQFHLKVLSLSSSLKNIDKKFHETIIEIKKENNEYMFLDEQYLTACQAKDTEFKGINPLDF